MVVFNVIHTFVCIRPLGNSDFPKKMIYFDPNGVIIIKFRSYKLIFCVLNWRCSHQTQGCCLRMPILASQTACGQSWAVRRRCADGAQTGPQQTVLKKNNYKHQNAEKQGT